VRITACICVQSHDVAEAGQQVLAPLAVRRVSIEVYHCAAVSAVDTRTMDVSAPKLKPLKLVPSYSVSSPVVSEFSRVAESAHGQATRKHKVRVELLQTY
jgi:hypothetical protein